MTREGGISWSEALVRDDYGTDEECARARASDQDSSWEEFANDPDWDPFPGFGGFCFLDAIGFRYFLPAAMVQVLRGNTGTCGSIEFHLERYDLARDGSRLERQAEHLTTKELQCICEFIKCMIKTEGFDSSMTDTYLDYWIDIDQDPL